MAYIVDNKRVSELRQGDIFEYENPCDGQGGHPYSEYICPKCGRDFCYNCCGFTNVDQGGKHDPDFMSCPDCGHDIFSD